MQLLPLIKKVEALPLLVIERREARLALRDQLEVPRKLEQLGVGVAARLVGHVSARANLEAGLRVHQAAHEETSKEERGGGGT